ncbi:C-type lectin domain-containing protein [Geminocystis sp. GBBB08]|uniref:C-type lectin domain-containing protein n=1 Tax=Geminocystis sp. GBBB08 TaxID=2604140 RepID=UPI0027E23635|nr:C-type lectin domain-containing protein [Geminocystis sp. GBBB08]MBL1208464.1 hypothetical protein [Geminocystis sp. GBBB08]
MINKNHFPQKILLGFLTTFLSLSYKNSGFCEDMIKITNRKNQHQYVLTPEMSWQDAQNLAKKMGGNLVTINDEKENQWLVDTFVKSDTNFLWIGLNDQENEGEFIWVSGEKSDYYNWAKDEPNDNPKQGGEDYGVLNGFANPFNRPVGTWSDAPIHVKLKAIVEITLPILP